MREQNDRVLGVVRVFGSKPPVSCGRRVGRYRGSEWVSGVWFDMIDLKYTDVLSTVRLISTAGVCLDQTKFNSTFSFCSFEVEFLKCAPIPSMSSFIYLFLYPYQIPCFKFNPHKHFFYHVIGTQYSLALPMTILRLGT